MRVLFCFDKFKHSLSAAEACAVAGEVAVGVGWEWEACPIADGGEGFTAAMAATLPGEWRRCQTEDALGREIEASWYLAGRTGVMEMSAASGMDLVRDLPRQLLKASTRGTGLIMRDALKTGVTKLIVGLGGSATNDGGSGMAEALGWVFEGANGRLPENLMRTTALKGERPTGVIVEAACDVTNPLLGPNGATRVYGPQKGALDADFPVLEERLRHLEGLTGVSGEFPGAGAAGGLGYGLKVFAGAVLRPGFEMVSEACGLEEAVKRADLVVTGEGRLDAQSLCGKGPHGVALMAARHGKKTAAVCGVIDKGEPAAYELFTFAKQLIKPGMTVEEAIPQGARLLREALTELFRGLTADGSAAKPAKVDA